MFLINKTSKNESEDVKENKKELSEDEKKTREYCMNFRKKRLEYNLPQDVQNWCKELKDHTFETHHFPLSYQQCQSIINFYKANVLHSKTIKYTEKDKNELLKIKEKLEEITKKMNSKSGYFIRLSSRSPKDACLYEEKGIELKCVKRMKQSLKSKLYEIHKPENLEKLKSKEIDTLGNQEYSALMIAACDSLKCNDVEEMMELLLFSERVYVDTMLYLDFPEHYNEFPMHVICRKWMDDLPYENEFRGFVNNSKLTACCQYDNYCYFPNLVKKKEEIGKRIEEYYQQISPLMKKLGFDKVVVDFGITKKGKLFIIELNSFDDDEDASKKGTGSACFHWKKDNEQLKNGPFLFKVTEKPPFTDLKTQVPPDWMRFINNTRKEVIKEIEEENSTKCVIS